MLHCFSGCFPCITGESHGIARQSKKDAVASKTETRASLPPPVCHEEVGINATTPSFQMPVQWELGIAMRLVQLADSAQHQVTASVEGYSTPSTVDVGGASLRLRFSTEKHREHLILGGQGSITLCVRRNRGQWLPAIAGVPGHHSDRAGIPRHGLLEVMIMARPTSKGGITFVPEDALRAWIPIGAELEFAPLKRLGDFHIDDGSGPWLRDRICITLSEAEDFALANGGSLTKWPQMEQLLAGSGFFFKAGHSPPPLDEWDLARTGSLHRDVG